MWVVGGKWVMGGLIESLEWVYLSKYEKLEWYGKAACTIMFVVEVLATRLTELGMLLIPILVLCVERWRPIHGFLFVWGMCEVWFYVYQSRNRPVLEEREKGYWDGEKRTLASEKLLDHLGDPADSAVQLLRKWNKRQSKSSPCMAHFVKVLVWMMFDKAIEDLTIDEARESQRMLQRFKEKLEIPSVNQGERIAAPNCIRPTLDPISYKRKSFMFYLVIAIFRLLALAYIWHCGFKPSTHLDKKHVYWVKTGLDEEDPLVVSAGIGTGIVGYFVLIHNILCQYPDRTIVLFETPYVNLQPAAPVMTEKDSLREIDLMFSALGLEKCTWLGHSFGTVIAGWVVKHRPHYITKLILVDPVCFRTWDASLYRALCYTVPDSIETRFFQFFMAQDPALACEISRHLNWFECTLFPEQMTMPTQIFISEKDFLLDPIALTSYLYHRILQDNLSHIQLNSLETSHGLFILHQQMTREILSSL